MRSVPPADPRRDELHDSSGEATPPGPRPATSRSKTSRASAAAVVTLVGLAIIAVIVLV